MFRVYLPAFSQKQEENFHEELPLYELRGDGERVLIVEDESCVLQCAAKALRNNGYIVYEASSAAEALDIFKGENGEFHMVFCDVVLPDGSGVSLARQLRLQRPEIGILMCSGYTDEKSKAKIIQENGFAFLQKPYALKEILKAIKKVLTKTRIQYETAGAR